MSKNTVFLIVVCCSAVAYFAGSYQARMNSLPFQVDRIVEKGSREKNSRGIPAPYTILSYRPDFQVEIIPGIVGKPGQVVRIPRCD